MAASLQVPGSDLPLQRGGMGDHTVAMTSAAMVSAALFERTRTGKGPLVPTSLLRQGVYTLGFDINVAVMWGQDLAHVRPRTMPTPPPNHYTPRDVDRISPRPTPRATRTPAPPRSPL